MNIAIGDLTKAISGELILGDPRASAQSVSIDSRKIVHGCVFFALKGERADGHDFALSCARQGAGAVIVSRLDWLQESSKLSSAVIRVADTGDALRALGSYFRSTFKGPVIGITGSNGKTTTKQMVTGIMKTGGDGLSTSGNFNSQIGLPIVLSKLKEGDRWMVLEMGASAPGNIASLCRIGRPSIGIITGIGPAHLESFGSIERIAETKWELMDSLPADGCAIVPWGVSILDRHVRAYKNRMVFFGEDTSCPVRASQVEVGETVRFRLHIGSANETVQLPMPGRVNVGNALAAAAAGWVAGYDISDIARGLATFEPPRMRMETVRQPDGAVFINDAYNANPSSMLQAIQSLSESYPNRRRILVAGSMLELGTESGRYHFHIGTEIGRSPMEKVFLYGEEARGILEGALAAGAPADRVVWMATHEEISEAIRPLLSPYTVVLFKGSRGMQLEKVIAALGGH